MAISDEIKRETQKTKDMSLKGKLSYFWDYYKIHTIVAVLAVFIILSVVHDIAVAKDSAFYGVYLNALQSFSPEDQMAEFSSYLDIDTQKFKATLDTSLQYSLTDFSQVSLASSQKFAAMVQVGDIDTVVADEDVFANYARSELFFDLREILPEDLMEKYKDHIFYIDAAEIAAANSDDYQSLDEADEYYRKLDETFSDHHDPSSMENPIPAGIYVGSTPVISDAGCYPASVPVFGIVQNTTRPDAAVKYLRFLGGESAPPQ